MTWRGATTPLDRIFACLPYLLPLIESLSFSNPFFNQFPELRVLLLPLFPFISIYSQIFNGIPFGGLMVFLALFFLVVRNERILHFIRFNTMQSILLGILLSLVGLVWGYIFAPILGTGLITETIYNVIFLGTVAAVGYSVVQSALGRYAEIPTLSDAVYLQVR